MMGKKARDMGMTVAEIRAMIRTADADEFVALERSLSADARKGVQNALETRKRTLAAEEAETERVKAMYEFDRSALEGSGGGCVIGLDEVGRGAVAGPLAVGAVVLREEPRIAMLNDSKQLTATQRSNIASQIRETALAWSVFFVKPGQIDRDGMSTSLRNAFRGALEGVLKTGLEPDVVLVDGNPLDIDAREQNVVKGDSKSAAIAAASIVAKVTRDEYMMGLSSTYPQYGFSQNKGYASSKHVQAIREFGLTDVHRASFCKAFLQESLF